MRKVPYQELVNLYNYVEGYTIYSTQHSIKGDEFDNVFIVLDNGNWSNYNFKYLFEKSLLEFEKDLEEEKQKAKIHKKKVEEAESRISVLKRTQKIFYVCCTRTKENLVVLYLNPSDDVLKRANKWFDSNVKEI